LAAAPHMSAFDPDVPSPSKDPMWSASIQLKIADEGKSHQISRFSRPQCPDKD